MIRRALREAEGRAFDLGMRVVVPALIWWVNRGLRRPDLVEELREFQADLRSAT